MSLTEVNQAWLLTCCALLLVVQCGLVCLETALTRADNAAKAAINSLARLGLPAALIIALSAGLLLSPAVWGLLGARGIDSVELSGTSALALGVQTLFGVMAAAIFALGVTERIRQGAYAVTCLLIACALFPAGSQMASQLGWTDAVDWTAGAGPLGVTIACVTGGFAALGGALMVGPRLGRFNPARNAEFSYPNRGAAQALLGAAMVSIALIGVSCGGAGSLKTQLPEVASVTFVAGLAGGISALLLDCVLTTRPMWPAGIQGLLAGLVAVAALSHETDWAGGTLIGAGAGLVSWIAARWLRRLRIDDPVGAFPTFGVSGAIAVLCQGSHKAWAEGDPSPLLSHALGLAVMAATAFGIIYVLLLVLDRTGLLPITDQAERTDHSPTGQMPAAIGPADFSPVLREDAGALAAHLREQLERAFDRGDAATLAEAHRRQAESLRDYSLFLRTVLNGIDTQICILDNAGQIVETNESWDRFAAESLGGTRGTVGGFFRDICNAASESSPYDARRLSEAVRQVSAGEEVNFSGDYLLWSGGEERYFEIRVKPMPKHGRASVIVLQDDRTEQRRSELLILEEKQKAETLASALEASQASLELAMKGGELGLWHWDVGSDYFELSTDWARRLTGEEVTIEADVESFRGLLHPKDRVLWSFEDVATLSPDEPYDRQFRLRGPDGSYRWVHALGRASSHDADGVPKCLSGIMIDIDVRKSAEQRDAGMAKIIENSLNEVYVVDLETDRFLEVNRGARKNLGYSLDELRRMQTKEINADNLEVLRKEYLEPIEAGEAERVECESVHRRRDGSTYPILLNLQRARLMDRDVGVAIGVDLTQRRELESQLVQAQRLESIGQLAAGVAHEMNTPLQFVSNNIKFLNDSWLSLLEVIDAYEACLDPEAEPSAWRDRLRVASETAERAHYDRVRRETPGAIGESLEGIERVLQIVRAMREFSHPGDDTKTPTDLNRALSSTVTVTRNRWKDAAELELDLDPELPPVECEAGSINQVFVNLIVNAADAVTARRDVEPEAPPGRIDVRSYRQGDRAIFEIRDNGIGMPKDVQRRIFDPFFTTKDVGIGTGQGLSLSHTIVCQKHDGAIGVESTPGEGTLMRVAIPMHASPTTAKCALASTGAG